MKLTHYSIILTSILLVGCAELSELNQKVGDWAGKINQSVYGANAEDSSVNHNGVRIYRKEGSFTSRQNIDNLFIKVRREFGFKPQTNDPDETHKFYHTIPGMLYHVSGYFGYDKRADGVSLGDNLLEVVIEKVDAKNVSIGWKASGSEAWIKRAESRLAKTINN